MPNEAPEEPTIQIKVSLAEEAFEEALKRYPDSHSALIFLWGASGLAARTPTDEQLAWARERLAANTG